MAPPPTFSPWTLTGPSDFTDEGFKGTKWVAEKRLAPGFLARPAPSAVTEWTSRQPCQSTGTSGFSAHATWTVFKSQCRGDGQGWGTFFFGIFFPPMGVILSSFIDKIFTLCSYRDRNLWFRFGKKSTDTRIFLAEFGQKSNNHHLLLTVFFQNYTFSF